MYAKRITFSCQPCIMVCDAQCVKAWGIAQRPREQLSESDIDDYAFLADHELPEAPGDPGTGEGGFTKPTTSHERGNKWCVRQCERSVLVDDGTDFVLPDFTRRLLNKPFLHEGPAIEGVEDNQQSLLSNAWLEHQVTNDLIEQVLEHLFPSQQSTPAPAPGDDFRKGDGEK